MGILSDAWRELLPPNVEVSAGPFMADATPLTERERRSAGQVDVERMRELETGRTYARRALSQLGINNVELPVGPDRAPLWPIGIVGSLTHVRGRQEGHCAVAVGRSSSFRAIGIDVEYDSGLPPNAWPRILSARELCLLVALPVQNREADVLRRWCMKETVMKAAPCLIEPTDIDIEYSQNSGGEVIAWQSRAQPHLPGIWSGRLMHREGLIFAAVAVPN
jgi:4'-phosphopantetheinyl transferase EntD